MAGQHTQTTTARGYGYAHQQLRRKISRVVAEGRAYCSRCGRWISPGAPWDLDHTDDRRGYRGASHRICNQRAAHGKPPLVPQRRAKALDWFDA
jgi:hypothetical protein